MTTEDRLRVQANKILGEFLGTLEGILAWDIPRELRDRLKVLLEELRKIKIEPPATPIDLSAVAKELDKALESLTQEDIDKYFKDDTPKGWVSIEEHLPQMYAKDIEQGYSIYKVKDSEGTESTTAVTDHTMWYYKAKDAGITHWFNE